MTYLNGIYHDFKAERPAYFSPDLTYSDSIGLPFVILEALEESDLTEEDRLIIPKEFL